MNLYYIYTASRQHWLVYGSKQEYALSLVRRQYPELNGDRLYIIQVEFSSRLLELP